MSTRRMGTVAHRSFPYFLLRAATLVVGTAASVLLKLAFGPPAEAAAGAGFWSDVAWGSLAIVWLIPALLACAFGGRLIRQFWVVTPAPRESGA